MDERQKALVKEDILRSLERRALRRGDEKAAFVYAMRRCDMVEYLERAPID